METLAESFRFSWPVTLLIAIAILLVLSLIPKLQVKRIRRAPEAKGPLELENDYRQTLIQIVGGIAIVATIWVSIDNAQIARDSIELTRRGQVADRTFKAMDLLSKQNNVDAKLAAIYALEQVSNEDPRSEWQITQTLYNYVRIHSNWSHESAHKQPAGEKADIRAVGNFLARRPYLLEKQGTCLEEHQCWDYEKQNRPSREARLVLDRKVIDLPHVDLRSIYLEGAMLKSANIDFAHMEGSWLHFAHFDNAYGAEVHLEKADMSDSYWLFANLNHAHLDGAQLCRAHLEHVYAEGAFLPNADLENSNWSDVPKFRTTNLKGANLNCTKWQDAETQGLYLDGATVFGADLRGSHLTKQQLEHVYGDALTLVDPGLERDDWKKIKPIKCPEVKRPRCPDPGSG